MWKCNEEKKIKNGNLILFLFWFLDKFSPASRADTQTTILHWVDVEEILKALHIEKICCPRRQEENVL